MKKFIILCVLFSALTLSARYAGFTVKDLPEGQYKTVCKNCAYIDAGEDSVLRCECPAPGTLNSFKNLTIKVQRYKETVSYVDGELKVSSK